MRISVPRGTYVGAVQAQQDPPGPPAQAPADEEPLGSDEEWVTDSESDSEEPAPAPAVPQSAQDNPTLLRMQNNGMGGMVRMQNTGVHADFY